MQVAGRIYLNSVCNVEIQRDGSFSIGIGETARSKYFAIVDVDAGSGTARGFWNGDEASSHAHEELGRLTNNGACWKNERARICAFR